MLRRILLLLSLPCLSLFAASLGAQSGTIRYIYDELGRREFRFGFRSRLT